jgi:hypothetical protein
MPSNVKAEYTEYIAAVNKMRKDLVSLAAKSVCAGVDDGEKWQRVLEMLPDDLALESHSDIDGRSSAQFYAVVPFSTPAERDADSACATLPRWSPSY